MSIYTDRLVREWLEYDKIIVAVDYDDTISSWNFEQFHIERTNIVNILKEAQSTGIYLVCHTACDTSRYDEIKLKFQHLGLHLDSINQNPIPLPYGNTNKVYANIFLDDRAGLNEALHILEDAMYKVRGERVKMATTDSTLP